MMPESPRFQAAEIADVIRRLVCDMYTLHGLSQPREINDGCCDRFARYLVDTLDYGYITWGSEVAPDMPGSDLHCVTVIDGRYYDAEVPEGVDDIRDIPYFRKYRETREGS